MDLAGFVRVALGLCEVAEAEVDLCELAPCKSFARFIVVAKLLQYLLRHRGLRETPLYTFAKVAHHIHVPRATLRAWVEARDYLAAGELRHSPRVLVRPDRPPQH